MYVMNNWRSLCAVVSVSLWMACSGSDPVRPSRIESLPTNFRLTSEITKNEDNGKTLTCKIDFVFELTGELSRNEQQVIYKGRQGGPASRLILNKDGSGFIFEADTFGEVQVELNMDSGFTVIRIPINETSPNRFWKEMSRFDAVVDSNGIGNGNWTCAPLDIDQGNYVDKSIIAIGPFHITPVSAS